MIVRKLKWLNLPLNPCFGVTLVGIVLASPALLHGIPTSGYDSVRHIKWFGAFYSQFWSGEFYPRWLLDMNAGLGAPTFFFYAPGPYWISSLFQPFFVNDSFGWHALGFSSGMALIGSGLFMYLFLQNMVTRKVAFVGATLYMLAPYHASDLYSRAAISELFGMTCLPLTFYFTSQLLLDKKWSISGLALSYSFMIFCHLPVVLIVSPILLLYVLFKNLGKNDHKLLLTFVLSIMLGVGISAIYLVPVLTTQDNVRINFLSEWNWRPFDYYFIFNDFRSDVAADAQGKILIFKRQSVLLLNMLVVAGMSFYLIAREKILAIGREAWFWGGTVAYATFFATPLSEIFWKTLPLLPKVLFPYRFMVLVDFAVAILIALACQSLSRRPLDTRSKFIVLCLFFIGASWIYPTWDQVAKRYLPNRESLNSEIQKRIGFPEYWPAQLEDMKVGTWAPQLRRIQVTTGAAQIETLEWRPRKITLHVNAMEPSSVILGQFYYPNWEAKVIETSETLTLTATSRRSLLSINLPIGTYRVHMQLSKSPEEGLGQIISMAAIFILLILGGYQMYLTRVLDKLKHLRT